MKTIKELIFKSNFRHVFAVLILLTFVLITTLPFWIGSKGLTQHGWTYLVGSQGAITVLLTLAGRRYFDHKPETNELQKTENVGGLHPLIPIDNSGGSTAPTVCNTCGRLQS